MPVCCLALCTPAPHTPLVVAPVQKARRAHHQATVTDQPRRVKMDAIFVVSFAPSGPGAPSAVLRILPSFRPEPSQEPEPTDRCTHLTRSALVPSTLTAESSEKCPSPGPRRPISSRRQKGPNAVPIAHAVGSYLPTSAATTKLQGPGWAPITLSRLQQNRSPRPKKRA